MPVEVASILQRAQTLIQDVTGVRWSLPELAGWFNDALREVALLLPSATSKSVVLPLAKGTRQTIPDGALMLMRVPRNLMPGSTDGDRKGGRAIRLVDRSALDTQYPDWHDEGRTPFRPIVRHFVVDEAEPRAFYVYPGNDGKGLVEAVVSLDPPQVDASGTTLASYAADFPLRSIYANAVLDYVLYRAYSKDASFSENLERADAHYNAFAMALGAKTQRRAGNTPDTAPHRAWRGA